MVITATKEFSKVDFNWNDELTDCTHTALNVSDVDFKSLIDANVHEGSDLVGWVVNIEL